MQTLLERLPASVDRVRCSTAAHINAQIDQQTDDNIAMWSRRGAPAIRQRIDALDREWDIERVLEVKGASLALFSLVLGIRSNPKWFLLTGGVLAFLLNHGLRGWCPPLPLLRHMGVRTRSEIDREKYALLAELEKE